jgi:Predicted nucleotide-binding protein containing TIR-like domain
MGMIKRRIFISVPMDDHLDPGARELVHAVLRLISDAGFEPQRFLYSGLPASMGWNFQTVDEVMRRCVGAVIFALPRWTRSKLGVTGDHKLIPTEWSHYEGAVANTLRLPTLILAEKGIADSGIAWTGGGIPILFKPSDADVGWLKEETFRHRFTLWLDQLKERRDVFLGYCSKAREAANSINLFLTKLGVSVLDWADFSAGGNILDEIERASSICSVGIFLFTQDDMLEEAQGDRAAPRDNVVFEAGYFTQSKGRERVLIIREHGAKMPADVGGNIYLPLKNQKDISSIETQLRSFVEKRV